VRAFSWSFSSLLLSQTFVHLRIVWPTSSSPSSSSMCLWATMWETKEICVYIYDKCALLAADSRSNSSSLSLSLSLSLGQFFSFFPPCRYTCPFICPCTLYDTQERILTDCKPFSTDATLSSSSSSNVSSFCIPRAFRQWIHPRWVTSAERIICKRFARGPIRCLF